MLFDLLTRDIRMLEEDGCALVRQVRSLKPEQRGQIPAIALTIYAGESDRKTVQSSSF
ncbi:hypothetical protein [Pseudanabaena sp. FACHB-2040]|uniref:hypothetical protein n=1 Tax=Pseudanabaena sp. FACHB-2040 TaxID=2692859 RepID=UPI0016855F2E|nr:hypothetical protein [Pseudanabaena sp. FACHB-2040]MBD2259758.1 hypothetical protein [Pseudanabaena sp. FACHB-2040]